jgi:hypothetical protein
MCCSAGRKAEKGQWGQKVRKQRWRMGGRPKCICQGKEDPGPVGMAPVQLCQHQPEGRGWVAASRAPMPGQEALHLSGSRWLAYVTLCDCCQ